MAINILIADDDSLIRESLKIILDMDEEITVVEVVENGLEALKVCEKKEIDVALLDVRMPVMNGVEAAKTIALNTNTKVLILTTFDEDEYIKEALKNGVKGYILKNKTPDEIKQAIKIINKGDAIIQDSVLQKIRNNFENNEDIKLDKKIYKDLFTQREVEIMESISEGLSNKEIAKKLFITEGTVKNYITSIFNKTNLKHRTQIAIYYLKGGKIK